MNTRSNRVQRERLGILGGSFNPVHHGHLLLAQQALEHFELDRVLFMPCAVQPHKPSNLLAPGDVRQRMIEAAIMDNPAFELLDIEIRRGGVSYTVDALRELRDMFPHAELYFLIGADSLTELHRWKNIYTILESCRFAVFARPGIGADKLQPETLRLADPWPARLLENTVTARQIDISSSEIRHRVAEGLSIRYLVPQSVAMIIMEHYLYQ